MSLFSDNLRFLRDKIGESQGEIAKQLSISRSSYAKYELGIVEAPHRVLIFISRHYNVSLDLLLSVDIRKVDMEKLLKLEDNRILLPIAVDRQGENIIEIIPYKAKAGYLLGYSDPEFIESLQHISLPFLNKGKYRAFPIEGDSMPPHRDGSFIIGEYVENKQDIKTGSTYILLTKNDGIVYKRIADKTKRGILLSSDNKVYSNYNVHYNEIIEAWKFSCSLATKEFEADDLDNQTLKEMIAALRKDVANLKKRLSML